MDHQRRKPGWRQAMASGGVWDTWFKKRSVYIEQTRSIPPRYAIVNKVARSTKKALNGKIVCFNIWDC